MSSRVDVDEDRVGRWRLGGERFVGSVADFAIDFGFELLDALFGRGGLRGPGIAKISTVGRDAPLLRALRQSCRAFRRRRANANRGAMTCA